MKILWMLLLVLLSTYVSADNLVENSVLKMFSEEISGEAAKRNLEFLSRQHRMRGSRGFQNSVDYLAAELRKYGMKDVEIAEFTADGKKFYGTQRSRRPWDANFAELWEMKDGVPAERLASWDAQPLSLAQDSESAEITTALVNVGGGNSDSDYASKDVKGKIVLISRQPEEAVPFAIDRYGAAGLLSYAQNQRTAWWGEDENLLRWGHAGSFNKKATFAFMITPKQASALQQRLNDGEQIQLRAKVDAGQHSGSYQVLTAVIPGSDPELKNQEIVFSCHLDHPRPGANDNASGCVTILEIARAYSKLIAERKIERPARTLRFVWPPEIEGTLVFLSARPEIEKRILSAIHLDMVGGGPVTKAQFHVTRGASSLPSFIYDVVDHFAEFVNEQTLEYAETGAAAFPLVAPEGGKEPLRAILAPFSMGSDHEIYSESSFSIPCIYFSDWPDRYIHTNFDTPGNIDPTKLKRAGFLGAITAYYLANLTDVNSPQLWSVLQSASIARASKTIQERQQLQSEKDASALSRFHFWYEQRMFDSLNQYSPVSEETGRAHAELLKKIETLVVAGQEKASTGKVIYTRNSKLPGPMGVFGYNYLEDHFGLEKARAMKLQKHPNGSIYAYEALNFVDGKRTVEEIMDLLVGAYGPVPADAVTEYLSALETIGVVSKK